MSRPCRIEFATKAEIRDGVALVELAWIDEDGEGGRLTLLQATAARLASSLAGAVVALDKETRR